MAPASKNTVNLALTSDHQLENWPTVTVMDPDETRRQVIALLTATYTTLVSEDGTDFAEMTGPLINDLLSISYDFDITYTGSIEGLTHAVAERTALELRPRIGALIQTFAGAFVALSQAASPYVDVPGLLQEFARFTEPTESS